jgi:hypothetical protein
MWHARRSHTRLILVLVMRVTQGEVARRPALPSNARLRRLVPPRQQTHPRLAQLTLITLVEDTFSL